MKTLLKYIDFTVDGINMFDSLTTNPNTCMYIVLVQLHQYNTPNTPSPIPRLHCT